MKAPEEPALNVQDNWHLIDQVLKKALTQPAETREWWVRDHCRDQPQIGEEVLALMAGQTPGDQLFDAALKHRDQIVGEALNQHETTDQFEALAGTTLGPYRISSLIASGGMGAVYKAHRNDGEFKQTVAIKMLPAWSATRKTITRLKAERQIFSSLQHPYIPKLVDGGESGDGFPYLVTEFIDGMPITEYVEKHQLDIKNRLQLISKIALAVDYAHSLNIVHRDIKPSNVLVNQEGHPYLLDFGIAKLSGPGGFDMTMARTATGFSPMTPGYASPEQLMNEEVGKASDIYQLGLLLVTVLVGNLTGSGRSSQYSLLKRPSAVIKARLKSMSKGDISQQKILARQLRGDLDTIAMKALRADPAKRYKSASAFAKDIERHIEGKAINARRESLFSHLARTFRANPISATLTTVLMVVSMFWGMEFWTANRAPDHADKNASVNQENSIAIDNGLATAPDPEAYQLVEQAGFLMQRVNPDESQVIIDLLERAVEIDPDYFKAWYYLGDMYQRQAIWGIATEEEALPRSREANRRAAELAPDSTSVHIRMGWMAMRWDDDLEQAAVHIQRAVDLTEDPIQKVGVASRLLMLLGRTELLLKLAEHRVHENPTEAHAHWTLAEAYASDGQYTKSIQHLNTALILSPGIDDGNGFLSYVLLLDNQFEAALETAALEKLPVQRLPVTVMALDELGRHEEAQLVFEEMVKEEQVRRMWQVEIFIRRGDKNRAFEILNDLSVDEGEIAYWLLIDPKYKPLHSDPRWEILVERISLASGNPEQIKLDVPIPEEWQ